MGKVRRIYVEKKEAFAVKARELQEEIRSYLGIEGVTGVRVLMRYDVENISDEVFERACRTVFAEPPVDILYRESFETKPGDRVFSVEYLPGQFDQRADSAVQCVRFLREDEEPVIRTATTYVIEGSVSEEELAAIKSFCINPVDSRQSEEAKPETLVTVFQPDETVASLSMIQKWPIRVPRPVTKRFPASRPLVTGQRILDTLFPIAKGGTAAIPGGFGTGKTMTQHSIAKWSDADIIVYIGCGERGNEMTEVLEDFSKLIDPKSGNPLMDRTVLIANTSNMPVAAREASIYTGLTLAEYYRDMGYHVAIMADSTSRWAEALRELSGRLEEMPAEEGFPAYLASRLSAFYERAGMVKTLNGNEGSVTIIGAVSPQGGDFSEPVTQNTKRFVRCFWGLDKNLAYSRHFPAINWMSSYSEYLPDLASWYADNVGPDFIDDRNQLVAILNQESSLMEIVKLIGNDVLPDDQKLTLEIARVIRLGFLQQNAFHPQDTCVPLEKQKKMMDTILYLYAKSKALISMGMPMSVLKEDKIFDKVISIKYDVENDRLDKFDGYRAAIDKFYDDVIARNA